MLTLIALSAALLQEPPAPPTPPEIRTRVMIMGGPDGHATLDRDGDGQVSREEFAAPMNEHFARMDADGDGRLSAGELSALHGPDGGGDLMVFHGGADGEARGRRIELRRPGGPAGDREEREIVIRRSGGPGMPMIIHGPGRDGPGESRIEVRTLGGPGHPTEMDSDGDGRISEAEFTDPLRQAFARMDADHSGFIEDGERGGDGDVRVFTHRIETPDED